MKPRKQRLHSAELRRLSFIGEQLKRIADHLERFEPVNIVAGDNDKITMGDIVTTYGVGSPGKVRGNVHFDAHIDQAVGRAEGDVIHDKTHCENHAAGGYAVDTVQNVDQRHSYESFNTNSNEAIKNLTAALKP